MFYFTMYSANCNMGKVRQACVPVKFIGGGVRKTKRRPKLRKKRTIMTKSKPKKTRKVRKSKRRKRRS